MRTTLYLAALVAALLALTACAADEPAGELAEPADDAQDADVEDAPDDTGDDPEHGAVLVEGFRFQPGTIEVSVGESVTWANEDRIRHTATAGTPDNPEGTFDVDLPDAGTSGSHTFDEPGTFVYFCRVHPSMTAEVVVTE